MPETSIFTPELFAFLRQLKRHNNRDWFARNKPRYQQVVVEPALRFIGGFAAPLAKLSSNFVADARPMGGSLFRIYRDTRFASDKRPYKTHVGISFRHAKGKDVHAPLFYLHLEPGGCFAAAGVWHPDNPTLTRIRAAIVRQSAEWAKISRKLELEGDSLMRPPRGYDPQHPFIEDIKRKDYVVSVALSEEQVCGASLMREFAAACKTMAPLVEFTTKALGLKF
jgi:uncharacterized protein (TIGR02453 family)